MLTDVSWSFMFVELYAAIVGLNVVYITTGVERILLQIPWSAGFATCKDMVALKRAFERECDVGNLC